MASHSPFSLTDILAIAKIHPFYASDVKYPPDADTIQAARKRLSQENVEPNLKTQAVLWRSTLYNTIARLVDDTNPQNTFRHSAYISITGGGTGSKPLFFATDVYENRRARADFGCFVRSMGLITDLDMVVTTHTGGELYRSLDLMLEILENAGASVLSAGQHMRPAEVAQLIMKYHANVLSGDSSQVVSIVHYISTLCKKDRDNIKLSKIIYTSEALTPSQRTHILEVLPYIQIYSILGSAEAGPYAVSYSHSTTSHWFTASYEDFIFDTRRMKIEILPLSSSEQDSHPDSVEDGEQGMIAQTSLMRLRNPLVRYVTGDVGSLHLLSKDTRVLVPETHRKYLRVLRLHGRDRRFSFEWDGEYLEFSALNTMLNDTRSGVLQWQVVLDKMEPTKEQLLQLYILRSTENADALSKEDLVHQIKTFFHVFSANSSRFKLVFLEDDSTFKRSETSRKVIKFINNYN